MPWLVAAAMLAGCAGTPSPRTPRAASESEVAACSPHQLESIESVRANIGGWCGTPDITAHDALLEAGDPVVPCLVATLTDDEEVVARFAAWVLSDLGETSRAVAWCRSRRRVPDDDLVCSRTQGVLARRRWAPPGGVWVGTATTARWQGSRVLRRQTLLRLDLSVSAGREVRGTMCEDQRCAAIASGLWRGVRVELTPEPGSGVQALVLQQDDDGRSLRGRPGAAGAVPDEERAFVRLQRDRQ
ncbi:MAG: hypothetical protein HYY06_32270 [Deltaproteobacteria bacterium]|nr:hypothetical protein [Deltaproteobacteria bacterium]